MELTGIDLILNDAELIELYSMAESMIIGYQKRKEERGETDIEDTPPVVSLMSKIVAECRSQASTKVKAEVSVLVSAAWDEIESNHSATEMFIDGMSDLSKGLEKRVDDKNDDIKNLCK